MNFSEDHFNRSNAEQANYVTKICVCGCELFAPKWRLLQNFIKLVLQPNVKIFPLFLLFLFFYFIFVMVLMIYRIRNRSSVRLLCLVWISGGISYFQRSTIKTPPYKKHVFQMRLCTWQGQMVVYQCTMSHRNQLGGMMKKLFEYNFQ